jgi:hypothetical protein
MRKRGGATAPPPPHSRARELALPHLDQVADLVDDGEGPGGHEDEGDHAPLQHVHQRKRQREAPHTARGAGAMRGQQGTGDGSMLHSIQGYKKRGVGEEGTKGLLDAPEEAARVPRVRHRNRRLDDALAAPDGLHHPHEHRLRLLQRGGTGQGQE